MKLKSISLLALLVLALAVLAGCAQDSTNITNENPEMQESVAKEKAGEAPAQTEGTNPSQTEAKGGAGSGNNTLALAADPTGQLKYDPTKLNANAGNITIAFTNDSAVPHDVAVEGSGGKKLGATKEITKSETDLKLKDVPAGTYTFFCTVPGHEQAGMKGTLTVR